MIDGQWAIVSEYIEGKTLAQLLEENPEKKQEYLEMFVDLQLEVLSKRCALLSKLKDKMKTKTEKLLENRYKKFRNIGKYSE